MAATLHLISGLPLAGKTTYAARLAGGSGAVGLSLDRWLITAFGRYAVDGSGGLEHARRVYACRELIWSVAAELLRRGVDVVLDDGFFLRNDREQHAAWARGLGCRVVIHFVDTPPDVLRARLAVRQRDGGAYDFPIAPEALETCLAIFQPPTADEGDELVVASGAGAA